MPVGGSEIADVHTLKDILLSAQQGFERVIEAQDAPFAFLVEQSPSRHLLAQSQSQAVVGASRVEVAQIFLHAAHGRVDAHVVVVENDEHVVGRVGGIVESFKGQSAAHGAVADDCHHMSALVPRVSHGRQGHAQGRTDGV